MPTSSNTGSSGSLKDQLDNCASIATSGAAVRWCNAHTRSSTVWIAAVSSSSAAVCRILLPKASSKGCTRYTTGARPRRSSRTTSVSTTRTPLSRSTAMYSVTRSQYAAAIAWSAKPDMRLHTLPSSPGTNRAAEIPP